MTQLIHTHTHTHTHTYIYIYIYIYIWHIYTIFHVHDESGKRQAVKVIELQIRKAIERLEKSKIPNTWEAETIKQAEMKAEN